MRCPCVIVWVCVCMRPRAGAVRGSGGRVAVHACGFMRCACVRVAFLSAGVRACGHECVGSARAAAGVCRAGVVELNIGALCVCAGAPDWKLACLAPRAACLCR